MERTQVIAHVLVNKVIANGELNTYRLGRDPLSYYRHNLCKVEGMPSPLNNVGTTINASQSEASDVPSIGIISNYGMRGFGRVCSEVNIWASISTGRNARSL